MTKNRRERALTRKRWAVPFALAFCTLLFGAFATTALANHFYDSTLVSWTPHGNAPQIGRTTFKAMQLQDGVTARFVAGNQRTKWRFVTSTGKVKVVSRNAFFSSARKNPAHFLVNGIRWMWRTGNDKRYRFAQTVTGSYQNP